MIRTDDLRIVQTQPLITPAVLCEELPHSDAGAVLVNSARRTIEAILRGARHGDGVIGDGKILVLPLEEVIRIRTGERGPDAV